MGHFVALVRPDFGAEDWKPLELVVLADVADMLGISKGAVCDRRKRKRRSVPFPEPVAELSCGAIWLRSEVERYARRVGLPRRDS